jgi:hypothetical protein
MTENLITLDQIKALIKEEGLKPEQLFDDEGLKEIKDKARAEGYAEGSFKLAWEEDQEKKKEDKDNPPSPEEDKYLDPVKNPFIKVD